MTRIAKALSLLIAIVSMAGCESKPSLQIESLQTPQSPLQLVRTIWRLSASGLVLDSQLYTVENLKRAFGGSKVDLEIGKYDVLIGSYWAGISGFPSWLPHQDNRPLKLRRVTMHPDGELRALTTLAFQRPPAGVDLATIEQQFGKSWTEKPQPIPSPHRGPGPAYTSPDLSKTIFYKFGSEQSGWTATFDFDRDGILSSMDVEVNRTK